MMQGKPFSALASAFDQYFDELTRVKDSSDWAHVVASKLLSALGEDSVELLIKIIPKLSCILACKTNAGTANDSAFDKDCQHSMHRLRYLLCQFVEVISSVSPVAVTLFLDDIQWADAASISVLKQILMKGQARFFFLGCCRDDEMQNDHPFWKMTTSTVTL
jgi:predicted ATPase